MERGRSPLALAAGLLVVYAAFGVGPTLAADDACTIQAERAWCTWEVETNGGMKPPQSFHVPHFDRTLVRVVVAFTGYAYAGYHLEVRAANGDLLHFADSPPPIPNRLRYDLIDDASFLVRSPESEHLVLTFQGRADMQPSESVGQYHVTWLARPLPEGREPARPAATRDDPHLADDLADAHPPPLDVVAFWFDDARVGDELFEAHLAVGSLHEDPPEGTEWTAQFRVAARAYNLTWIRAEDGYLCELEAPDDDFDSTGLGLEGLPKLYAPTLWWDVPTATFTAQIPVAWIESPPDATPFTIERVFSSVPEATGPFSLPRIVDVASGERYPFALGGERVWDALNPRLSVPWYLDPLAAQHLADSLQVAGAALAAATFLGGYALVQRRRKRAKRLLDEVDAVTSRHASDARAALLALGRLEARIDASYRGGDITEGEYQLVSQRIATSAARLALRSSLGLDDGVSLAAAPRSHP